MIHNKFRYLLTLVALFAISTGAWAEDIKATASDIGKVLCTDGSIYATKAEADAANKTAVAMIAYIDTENNKGLALALSNAGSGIWCSLANAFCLDAQYANTTDVITDMDGIANTDALVGHDSHTHTAASLARNYSVTRPEGASAWFLPSAGQWQKMIDAAGGFANLRTNAGMQSGNYWTSTEYNKSKAFLYDFNAGSFLSVYKDEPRSVRSAFEFDIVPSAPAITVEWDASTKTGTFSMPGSDVVLTPLYAPAAKWDVVENVEQMPAALEGIIAGQDAAIVTPGQSAQGTPMYAVTPTAEAAPALTAFSATVPTAKTYDDATTVYVWYYIQGHDTPDGQQATEENTFNDSEISATPLKVDILTNKFDLTLSPAPVKNMTVTVAGQAKTPTDEGKVEAVKMQSEVKLKAATGYKFRKVEVKKVTYAEGHALSAAVVGELIGSDGKAYAADDKDNLPNGVTAVALVCYVGEAGTADAGSTTYRGLALALTDVSSSADAKWCSQKDVTCMNAQYANANDAKTDMNGIANTDALVAPGSHTHAVASAARNYNGGTHPTGTSAWFLPSAGQWDKMTTAAGSYGNLRDGFEVVGGTNMQQNNVAYPSSTEKSYFYIWAYRGTWVQGEKTSNRYVRAAIAF